MSVCTRSEPRYTVRKGLQLGVALLSPKPIVVDGARCLRSCPTWFGPDVCLAISYSLVTDCGYTTHDITPPRKNIEADFLDSGEGAKTPSDEVHIYFAWSMEIIPCFGGSSSRKSVPWGVLSRVLYGMG